jgi:hypothetical protein
MWMAASPMLKRSCQRAHEAALVTLVVMLAVVVSLVAEVVVVVQVQVQVIALLVLVVMGSVPLAETVVEVAVGVAGAQLVEAVPQRRHRRLHRTSQCSVISGGGGGGGCFGVLELRNGKGYCLQQGTQKHLYIWHVRETVGSTAAATTLPCSHRLEGRPTRR